MTEGAAVATLRLSLLGTPQIERDGTLLHVDTRKAVALVAYLAVTGSAHSRGALAALLWPDYEPERAYANLRRTLWALNKAAGPEWFEAEGDRVALARRGGLWIDVEAFRQHLSVCEAHSHAPGLACNACLPELEAAAKLYRDTFLAGFSVPDSPAFEEWQFFESEGLRRALALTLERLANTYGGVGRFEQAIPYARRWLGLDPLYEPAHRSLMQLYAWSGQRAAALRQYEECARIVEREIGAQPEAETVDLYQAVRAGRVGPPPWDGLVSPTRLSPLQQVGNGLSPARQGEVTGAKALPPHNLPAQPAPFVGRETELAEITGLLQGAGCRLLTLTGPGGIGKTRLALEAAWRAAGEDSGERLFSHGLFFVPLAGVESAAFIAPAIADAVGLSFFQRSGLEATKQLCSYLSNKRMLLILDNLEHLMDGSLLVAEILSAAQGVKVLATSRQRLDLRGEWVREVRGMSLPETDAELAAEQYSALALFMQRARMVDAAFAPSPAEASTLVRICRMVGGLPLGIELAAAWVRLLPLAEIAAEIEHGPELLVASGRDLPERHRSLRAVFDHSWRLLSHEEKGAFCRLSIFRGGFSRDAAAEVSGAGLMLLSTLVDKSLLRWEPSGRYTLHEVLRNYAAERLASEAEVAARTSERHCRFFMILLARREQDLRGARQVAALDEIASEMENVRLAWRWAVQQRMVDALRQGAGALYLFYLMRGRLEEGEAAFGQAVAALESAACVGASQGAAQDTERQRALGMMLTQQGSLGYYFRPREEASALIRRAVEILRPLGPTRELAFAKMMSAYHVVPDEPFAAEALIDESLSIVRELSDQWGIARCLAVLAFGSGLGDAERSGLLKESLAISREMGDRWGMAFTLHPLGEWAHSAGAFGEARQYFEQGLEICCQIGDRQGMSVELDYLGYVAREQGDYAQARRLHENSLALSEDVGDRLGVAGSLDNLGLVARDQGEYEEAERLLQAGLAIRRETAGSWELAVSLEHLGTVALAQGENARAEAWFRECLAAARDALWDQGTTLALSGLAQACAAQGRLSEARADMSAALMMAGLLTNRVQVQDSLLAAANLLGQTGQSRVAAGVLAFSLSGPCSHATRQRAERMLAKVAAELGPGAVAEARAWAQGKSHVLVAEAAQELLSPTSATASAGTQASS